MKSKIYKAAIIGCGNIAGKYDEEKKSRGIFSHAGAFRESKRVKLIAAADIKEKRLEEFCTYWKVRKRYKDYKELLKNETIDILSICTPDSTHYDIITSALNIAPPKLVFAEKPLADSPKKVLDIIELAKKKGVKIAVNYPRRWEKEHIKVRNLIRAGKLGNLQAVSAYYVKGIRHVACHTINTLQFIIGQINSVMALGADNIGTFGHEDPSLDAILFFKNGTKAVVQSADKNGYTYSIFEIDIIGSRGRIRFLENGEKIQYCTVKPYRNYPGFNELVFNREVKTEMDINMLRSVQEIVKILDQGKEDFSNNPVESYSDLLVVDAIMESARKKGALIKVSGENLKWHTY